MIARELLIINRLGLHARAAAKLVATASRFSASIKLQKDGKSADAKSIMAVMMLAAGKGSHLTVQCDGEDEAASLAAVEALIQDRFGEDE
ncbi:MAG: HPr family phosphocarrier protein [Gammaproteobacteria bacterium]|jgi:phosphocarrier protein|nr:HPr family phosphocarrier protein [Gammaproteobacteria bacterium]MBP6051723.1 HPr family phosphocarrier protein [Pseudomonadales bacterium]MBK6584732.1 HPr family phosphocarrier protein [Gammaproteobacteria bacterium]MBK7171065.1 HPr family phosphocarrier protein [Gammaproteobacteria bacterium]MBK7519759.1 HPr family phosphocarrier protein [Gammaproteobacteria bacterium]